MAELSVSTNPHLSKTVVVDVAAKKNPRFACMPMVSTNVCAVQDTAAPILLKAAPVSFIEIKMREILIFNFLFMFRNLHLPTEIGVGKHQQDHVAFR